MEKYINLLRVEMDAKFMMEQEQGRDKLDYILIYT